MADDILSADELGSPSFRLRRRTRAIARVKKLFPNMTLFAPINCPVIRFDRSSACMKRSPRILPWCYRLILRVSLEVTLISFGQLTFDVFRNSLASPTVINILSMEPVQERALLTMDMKLAFSLIDRMFGGPGKSLDQVRAPDSPRAKFAR